MQPHSPQRTRFDSDARAACIVSAHVRIDSQPATVAMADPSGDGCPHSSRLDDAATADRRCNLNAVTASRPTCLHNHYHQQQRTTTALTVVGFDDPPNADEHPESSEKLALGFILNNGASTGTAADRAPASAARGVDAVSLMGLNCDHDQLQLQQQPYMPSSSVESSRRARVRSYSSDDRRGRVSSIAGHRMTNSVVSRPRTARIDYDSSPLSVSSLIQDMQVSSPATAGHRGASAPAAKRGTAEQSKLEKKRGRMCKTEGCENYIVHKGLCCRHGVSESASADPQRQVGPVCQCTGWWCNTVS